MYNSEILTGVNIAKWGHHTFKWIWPKPMAKSLEVNCKRFFVKFYLFRKQFIFNTLEKKYHILKLKCWRWELLFTFERGHKKQTSGFRWMKNKKNGRNKRYSSFEKRCRKKNRYFKRQNRKVIWDMINIHCSWNCSGRIYFCCFPLALANIHPWPLVSFF